jgi:hypothetical protein
MIESTGDGFAKVAAVLSFIAGGGGAQNRSGDDRLAAPVAQTEKPRRYWPGV